MELVSIGQVAKKLGISYHAARNRLNRNPKCEELKHKVDYSVVYERDVIRILKADDKNKKS